MHKLFMRRVLAVIGAAVIVSGAWTKAAVATGTVKGSVSRGTTAMRGVRVEIESAVNSSYGASAVTDDEGAFTFADVPLGEVHLKAYDGRDRVLVSADAIVEIDRQIVVVTLNVTP